VIVPVVGVVGGTRRVLGWLVVVFMSGFYEWWHTGPVASDCGLCGPQ
jgi:hypothetical protein